MFGAIIFHTLKQFNWALSVAFGDFYRPPKGNTVVCRTKPGSSCIASRHSVKNTMASEASLGIEDWPEKITWLQPNFHQQLMQCWKIRKPLSTHFGQFALQSQTIEQNWRHLTLKNIFGAIYYCWDKNLGSFYFCLFYFLHQKSRITLWEHFSVPCSPIATRTQKYWLVVEELLEYQQSRYSRCKQLACTSTQEKSYNDVSTWKLPLK